VVDRLFEVVLIQILRTLMDSGAVAQGLLAGLVDPRLARSLVALHAAPARAWTLERLARSAGMSRSSYAATFRDVVGATPGDYVSGWRLLLAQDALRRGRPLKLIVDEVGYGSAAALSRAFKAGCGLSPRAWKARHAARAAVASGAVRRTGRCATPDRACPRRSRSTSGKKARDHGAQCSPGVVWHGCACAGRATRTSR
jgi:AraC-like DNA-binding protein